MSAWVLIANCENVSEPDGVPCTGTLRFTWGMAQAACNVCGGWCGISVADFVSIEWGQPGRTDR